MYTENSNQLDIAATNSYGSAGKVNFNTKTFSDFLTNEAFKSLRTNLLFCTNECKTILITSCEANDGKSTTSTNIAKSLAEINKKTILIDADMRNSIITPVKSKKGNILGLSEYLSDQAEISQVLYNTQFENFDVIFSGHFPPNPAELISSKKFKCLLEELKNVYDYIIIDTPPVGIVTDAAIIASICDGAILMVTAGKTKARDAIAAKRQIENSSCKILGAVINHTISKKHIYKRYAYKKNYRYYSKK